MSLRPGSSRTLGAIKQCSIYARSGLRCVWCEVFCPAREYATIDHLDADIANNEPRNLVLACVGCNSARSWDWGPRSGAWTLRRALEFGWFGFGPYLERKGADLVDAIYRVEALRWTALPRETGAALARRWHGERLRCRSLSAMRYRASVATQREADAAEERRAIQAGHGDVSFALEEYI